MHVAFVHKKAHSGGGAERVVQASARALRQRGVRCVLYYDLSAPFEPAFAESFDAAFPLVEAERQLGDADVIYVHQLWGGVSMDALMSSGRPVFRFLHDHSLFCARVHKYRSWDLATCRTVTGPRCIPCAPVHRTDDGVQLLPWHRLRRDQRAHRPATLVVASRYLARHAAAHGFEKIAQVPLFVDEVEPSEAERDPHRIVFAGALLRSKGLDVLLEAMTRAETPFSLDVYGAGRQEGWLRSEADRLGVSDRVHFVGHVSDLREAYSSAGVVVLPSRTPETFGLTGADALAHGAAVVTTAVGGVGEWAIPGRTALTVPPNEPDALAQALDRFAEAPALRERLGRQGRLLVRERFTMDRHLEALLALFRSASREVAA